MHVCTERKLFRVVSYAKTPRGILYQNMQDMSTVLKQRPSHSVWRTSVCRTFVLINEFHHEASWTYFYDNSMKKKELSVKGFLNSLEAH